MNYFGAVCLGFLGGIVVSSFVLSDTSLFFFLILSLVLFFYTHLFEKGSVRTVGFIVSFLLCGIFVGQFRVLAFEHSVSHDLEKFQGQSISLVGEIISEPVSNGETQKFTVSVSGVSDIPADGRVLITTELFPIYHYGDVVNIKGQLKKPENVIENDRRVFDYPTYLLKDKITHTISFGVVESTGINSGNPVIRFLYGIKEKFVESIQSVLPEPEAGLLAGITLGTQTLSKNLSQDFRTAGLSHIVVLSGYNITIVADSAMAVALFFAPAFASFIAVFFVVFFVLMSGAGASSVRAGIMALVALLGKRFGKSYSAGRALFFAGFLMILWNPMTLLYDPSFHLSFLATVAMIYFSPSVYNFISLKLKFITEKFGLRETLATTLAVNLFVLPYILYMSGSIQIFALPANMLVLPFVSTTMFLGQLVGIFGFFGRFVGLIVGIPSYIILYYDLFVAETFSHVPFAQVSIPYFSLWVMIVIYFIFGYFLYKRNPALEQSSVQGKPQSPIVTSNGYIVIGD